MGAQLTRRLTAGSIVAAGLLLGFDSRGELPYEAPGRVEQLPAANDPHWLWVSDLIMQRQALVDLDDGRFLGMITTGYNSTAAAHPRTRAEIYVPETYFSRGSRGERTDVVTIYDAQSLEPRGEIEIPAKRAINVLPSANLALSDDDRFLAVFNMTPATSLSIVDVARREFVAEIETPGCSLVYAAGERRFLMLCGDGALLVIELDDSGREAGKRRSEAFFDPRIDPVTEKAVRSGDVWIFVSFEGMVHSVDVSGAELRFEQPWSLLSDDDGEKSWRIGGSQHLAVHAASGRLYSLMHEGGVDTHKDPGTELWIYDLESRSRLQRMPLKHPGFSLMGQDIDIGREWAWPFNRLWDVLLDSVIPNPGLIHVQVTQDEEPLLITSSMIGSSMAVYDARSTELLRRVSAGNLTVSGLAAPWRPPGGKGH